MHRARLQRLAGKSRCRNDTFRLVCVLTPPGSSRRSVRAFCQHAVDFVVNNSLHHRAPVALFQGARIGQPDCMGGPVSGPTDLFEGGEFVPQEVPESRLLVVRGLGQPGSKRANRGFCGRKARRRGRKRYPDTAPQIHPDNYGCFGLREDAKLVTEFSSAGADGESGGSEWATQGVVGWPDFGGRLKNRAVGRAGSMESVLADTRNLRPSIEQGCKSLLLKSDGQVRSRGVGNPEGVQG